jgi:multicomponent Na+:H+ antiporter subunit B
MNTLILRTATKYLLPLLLLFSVFILLRGHYLPGGGFVGGLIASIAFVLHALANGTDSTKQLLGGHPGYLIPIGFTTALLSAIMPLIFGKPLLTGLWYNEPVPIIGSLGSALFFDIGVYLVVIGVVLTVILSLTETEKE